MIIRDERHFQYFLLNRGAVDDVSLPWAALGVYAAIAMQDSDTVDVAALVKLRPGSAELIQEMIDVLIAAGWLTKTEG